MAETTGEIYDLLDRLYQPAAETADELALLRSSFQEQLRNSSQHATSSSSATSSDESARSGVLGALTPVLRTVFSGLPLVSGLLSLFGGDDGSPEATPTIKYSLPPAIQVSAGLFQNGRSVSAVDYTFGGDVRMAGMPASGALAMPPVVVNVQAMDSRSFLDRSDDIADAVRKALLNSHPLSDLVG